MDPLFKEKEARINYTLPSGFIEYSPAERAFEVRCLDLIRRAAERYGFCSIETPAVERLEVLHAKGNQGDNLIYSISPIVPEEQRGSDDLKAVDDGGEARGLRFDLTVPLAAYIARNLHNLTFPFARYQMDYVFRGERAKKGRYRCFRQCDFDIVGRGSLPLLYDALMPALINEIFTALSIGEFRIHINNRKVLCGFFESLGVTDDKIRGSIKIVDNVSKVGFEKTVASLYGLGISQLAVERIVEFVRINGSALTVLQDLDKYKGCHPGFDTGLAELQAVASSLSILNVPDERVIFDMSIARGLGYYTGTVYETTLVGHENLGSICSGGRYEKLVGIFAREELPGVGISIGWTRLFSSLLDRGELRHGQSVYNNAVAVLNVEEQLMSEYLKISSELRAAEIVTLSVFENRSLGKQFSWASKQGARYAVVVGSRELAEGLVSVKNLENGSQESVKRELLCDYFAAQMKSINVF
jgi:histidyl-tRNA synthetase